LAILLIKCCSNLSVWQGGEVVKYEKCLMGTMVIGLVVTGIYAFVFIMRRRNASFP